MALEGFDRRRSTPIADDDRRHVTREVTADHRFVEEGHTSGRVSPMAMSDCPATEATERRKVGVVEPLGDGGDLIEQVSNAVGRVDRP